MKIKDGFILRNVADTYIVVAVGAAALDFNGLITVNETGAFLWNKLSEDRTEEELTNLLLDEYDVSEETAKADVSAFLGKLKENDILV